MKLKILNFLLWFVIGLCVAGIGWGVFVYKEPQTQPEQEEVVITIKKEVYDGSPFELSVSETDCEVSVKYKLEGASDQTLTQTAPVNVGNYVAVVVVKDKNDTTKEERVSFTIKPIELTLNWVAPTNLIYDGKTKTPTLNVAGVLSGDICSVDVSLTAGKDNINVGDFTFTAVSVSNPNYILPGNKTSPVYSISKATYDMSNARWDYTKAFDYNGQSKSVYVVGLPNGVEVESYTNNVKTNIGKYVATAKLKYDTRNYNQPTISNLSWHISSKNFNVVITQTSTNYAGEKLSSVKVSCNDPTATLVWVNGNTVLSVGTTNYQIRYISADGERNELINVSVEAEKQPLLVKVVVSMEKEVYDGKPFEATVSETDYEVSVKYKLEGASDQTLTQTAPINVGNYVAVVVVKDGNNVIQEERLSFPILPISLALNWSAPANLVYDGKAKIPSLNVAGVLSGDVCNVNISLTTGKDNVNVGDFTYTAVSVSNSNYVLSSNKLSPVYSISKATYDMSNARWDYTKAFDYNGQSKSVYVVGLPNGVEVESYTNNVKTNIGKYVATAKLKYDTRNYNQPTISNLSWHISSKNFNVVITQTSTNYAGEKLSSVAVSCNDPTATLVWVNGNTILSVGTTNYQIRYISADGERNELINVSVEVKDLQIVDSYVLDEMYFELDHSDSTADVRANSDAITKAIIPEKIFCNNRFYTVTGMPTYAFKDMDNLTEVYIPKTITVFRGVSFANCDNLTKVRFADELKRVDSQMFMYCYALNDVILPRDLTEIPIGLFYDCDSITSMTIPSGVTKLGNSCFYSTNLTEITLPEGVTSIGNYAFNSTKLTSIIIPQSVITIGKNAFNQCVSLQEVRILSEEITLGEACFDGCRSLRSVFVNSATLINNLNTNTEDTHCLFASLQNTDIVYVKDTITNITSAYFLEMFTETESGVAGYNAYVFGQYTIRGLFQAKNRIYVKNSGLYGDEYMHINTPAGQVETVMLNNSILSFFDTSYVGKKMARITYKGKYFNFTYYVLNSLDDSSFNCIAEVSNVSQTYVLGEDLTLSNAKLYYVNNDNGYMKTETIPITQSMVTNFSTSSIGSRTMTITYGNYEYDLPYNVKNAFTETVTSQSFDEAIYYAEATIEETTHFIIKIKKGSYIPSYYKTMIEEVYAVQEEVTGLKHADKVTLDIDDTNYPSCGGTTLHITSKDLFLLSSSTFSHELAHALDHAQGSTGLTNSVLTEGFASYIEYLTAKRLFEINPYAYSYGDSYNSIIHSSFAEESTMYDYEEVLLRLDRDQLATNSQYEVGARVFSYLHYRYGDFCGWMKQEGYNTSNIDSWISLMKTYYNNQNLFKEIHPFVQSMGDKYYSYLGADGVVVETANAKDLTYLNMYNYYMDFSILKDYWGNSTILYKDLYVNIDSIRHQLNSCDIEYNDLMFRTTANITIELYDESGELINTLSNTTTAFSLEGVSFIKLVGFNKTTISVTMA